MDEFDFGDFDFGDFDLSGLENMDLSGLEGLDLSGLGDLDLSSLEGLDLSGLEGLDGLADVDMSGLSFEGLDPSVLESLGLSQSDDGGGGTDFGTDAELRKYFDSQTSGRDGGEGGGPEGLSFADSLDDMEARIGDANLGVVVGGLDGEGGGRGLTARRFNIDGSDKSSGSNKFGNGINMKPTITGRGEVAYKDPNDPTGATGLKSEYFRNINDLLETGTPEQVARLTSGAPDANDLFKGTGGEGFNADATRGAGLESMGGAQGVTRYIPAEYDGKGNIRQGTGGTFTELGFLPDKGTRYAIGDPGSWINNPAKTGEKAIVSSSNVVRSTGDPSKPTTVTTEKGQTPVVPGENKNIFDKIKDAVSGKSETGEKKDDWMKYIMLLMALDAMRNKGDGKSGAVIPSLTAGRSATPYAAIQNAPGYRPGQGGVQYFGPKVYRAGGGIGSLDAAGGRLLRGPGDGVSDDIVAQIGDSQPARLADGEYVLDARTVSEIGNGSTDAGADKIAQMVERIHGERRNAKRGEPSNADRKLLA
jgi:hypothetical protein